MTFFLSFIHSLCTTIRSKNRVLINLLILFVHDHSTKLGVTLTLLFILFLDVQLFRLLYSWQILSLHFIRYVNSSTTYNFRMQLTLYSLENCSYNFVRYIHGYMKSGPPLGSRFSGFFRVPLGSWFSDFGRVPLGSHQGPRSRFSGMPCKMNILLFLSLLRIR